MRLKQLQTIQTIKHQYQWRPQKYSWRLALILLAGSASLGSSLLSQPVAASTTTSVSSSSVTVASASAPVATSPTSSTMGVSVTSTASAATPSSAETVSATTVASSAPASATGTSADAGSTAVTASAATSNASAATSQTTSTTSASTQNGVGFVMPSLGASKPSSAVTAVSADSTGATPATTSAATSATSATTTSNAAAATDIATLPDSTVVAFGDPGITSAIQTDMNLTGPITLGDIRHFQGPLNIGTLGTSIPVTGTLAGMQYLQALPATSLIVFNTSYTNPNVDLTPLIPDHFSAISLAVHDMAAVNLAPLTQIDPTSITTLQLIGSLKSDFTDYQNNPQGLDNAQLAQLGPWLTAIDNAGKSPNFAFSDNSLTDFSPLSGFTKPGLVTALGQRVNYDTTPVNFVVGQPGQFTPLPLVGMNGESLSSHYQSTLSGQPTVASMTTPVEQYLVSLPNGQFEIPTAYPTVTGANWFAYGLEGYYNFTQYDQMATNFVHLNYPNGVLFEYDGMVYQPANWLTTPEVFIRYLDQNGTAIQPPILVRGLTIGAPYDLTPNSQITGYQLELDKSSALQGKYTQDPQYLTFSYQREVAGGITVNYQTADGQALAPSTVLTGFVGAPYTSLAPVITGYQTPLVSAGSATASGTLPLAATTVTYVYAPVTLQRTVQYVDTTTGKTLASVALTGQYQQLATYDPVATISAYEDQGYQLVNSDYPMSSAVFSAPLPTDTYQILLKHRVETILAAAPTSSLVLQQPVNRTIRYQAVDGTPVAAPVVETVVFTRSATVDQVTGAVTYGPWLLNGATQPQFAAVASPTLPELRANQLMITSAPVTPTTENQQMIVTYLPSQLSVATPVAPVPTVKHPVTPTNPGRTKLVSPVTPRERVSAQLSRGNAGEKAPQLPSSVQGSTPSAPQLTVLNQAANATPTLKRLVAIKPTKRPLPARAAATKLPQTGEHATWLSLLGLLLMVVLAPVRWFKQRRFNHQH
ncbi:MucBP domain-containing protein [Lactiplantibacillus carotarum]|uniref:MucBP domain-containing protein n=1 Tax=Lactiplantibacillus carotarum TaxID=2993456 RepID=UPI00298EE32A|nr:MucBP domain-containing protein [Lactiplantibacillus carotarum]